MTNFTIKEVHRKGRLCAYSLIPDEGYVLYRESDGYKSENPFSFPACEDVSKIIDAFSVIEKSQ